MTVFNIKSEFTAYSSVISSLSIILTETCIFSKISNKCKFYKNKKKFAYFQHAFHIQLIVDTYFYCNTKLFLNEQKDHQVYLFSRI